MQKIVSPQYWKQNSFGGVSEGTDTHKKGVLSKIMLNGINVDVQITKGLPFWRRKLFLNLHANATYSSSKNIIEFINIMLQSFPVIKKEKGVLLVYMSFI